MTILTDNAFAMMILGFGAFHLGVFTARKVRSRIESRHKVSLDMARHTVAMEADKILEQQREKARKRSIPNYGAPGYEGGPAAEVIMPNFPGYIIGGVKSGHITVEAGRKITAEHMRTETIDTSQLILAPRPLGRHSWANGEQTEVVGHDEHEAFPKRLTDEELCDIGGHLVAMQSTTCVRCNQVVHDAR